jgi:hypothetical protein
VVYEDLKAGQRAIKMCNHLNGQGLDGNFRLSLWNFAIFRLPELRELAASDAAEAALILISTHGKQQLPAHVKAWFGLWLSQRFSREGTLVALLDESESGDAQTPQISAYLEDVARGSGMDFFCHRLGSSDTDPVLETPLIISARLAEKAAAAREAVCSG